MIKYWTSVPFPFCLHYFFCIYMLYALTQCLFDLFMHNYYFACSSDIVLFQRLPFDCRLRSCNTPAGIMIQ